MEPSGTSLVGADEAGEGMEGREKAAEEAVGRTLSSAAPGNCAQNFALRTGFDEGRGLRWISGQLGR